jgi:hypothetical protein
MWGSHSQRTCHTHRHPKLGEEADRSNKRHAMRLCGQRARLSPVYVSSVWGNRQGEGRDKKGSLVLLDAMCHYVNRSAELLYVLVSIHPC